MYSPYKKSKPFYYEDLPVIEIIRGKLQDFLNLIKDKLYWASTNRPPACHDNGYFFCIDDVSATL